MSRTTALFLLLLVAATLTACAHAASNPFPALPEPVAPAGPTLARRVATNGAPSAYEIRFELRRTDSGRSASYPETLAPPALCAPVGGTAQAVVTNQMSYVSGVDVVFARDASFADPEIDVVDDGLELTVAIGESPRPGVAQFAFRLRTSAVERPLAQRAIRVSDDATEVSVQVPRSAVREALGVAEQPFGVARLLAHVPGSAGSDQIAVFATVFAVELDPLPDVRVFLGPDAVIDRPIDDLELTELLGRARSAPPQGGTVRLCVVQARSASELSPLADASVGIRTRLTAGVRLASRTETAFVADRRVRHLHEGDDWAVAWRPAIETAHDGLEVRMLDGGRLSVTYREPVRWSDAEVESEFGPFAVQRPETQDLSALVTLRSGEQLVPLVPDRDGRALCVLVRYEPE
jgi:hypothetical protein